MTNIYLADDDNDDKELLEIATAEVCPDINLHHVLDGQLLLKKLNSDFPPAPDLIFLDINMPVLNGHDALKHIREDKRFYNTPVIIYSTSVARHDVDKTYEAGADFFIRKPSSLDGIKQMMQMICDTDFVRNYQRPAKSDFILKF